MRCRHGDARAGTPRAARRTWPGKHGSYAAQNRRFRRGAQDGKSGRWRAAHLRGRARRKLQDAEAASRQLLQKGVFAKDLGEIPNSPASTALAASARTAVVVSRFPDPAEIGMKVSGSGHPVVEWAARLTLAMATAMPIVALPNAQPPTLPAGDDWKAAMTLARLFTPAAFDATVLSCPGTSGGLAGDHHHGDGAR